MKLCSLFSGIGGFEKGIQNAGVPLEIVFSNEWDKYARNVYEKNFGFKSNPNDIRKILVNSVPKFDFIVAGFPCQPFSLAGKRKGFSDERGAGFFEVLRMASNKQAEHILLENVRGLLSIDGGKAFSTIVGSLSDLGYCVEWQLLNSKHFGVPQNRERVFIHCFRRESGFPIFPIREDEGLFEEAQSESENVAKALTATDYKGPSKQRVNVVLDKIIDGGQAQRVYSVNGLASTLRGEAGGQGGKTGLYFVPKRVGLKFLNRNQKNIEGDYSFTIDSANTGGVEVMEGIRRLTPLECERLQGFPDGWTKYGVDGKLMSDTQRYRMLGNAVTVPVVEYLIRRIFHE